jgi:alpha-beta hydrolase superfamily lysophospholipase
VLLFHGYYANRYQVLGLAEGLRERHYETLLFELRGHGSRRGSCTLGVREIEDAQTVLQWAGQQEPVRQLPVGVMGFSLGAAVACSVALRTPLVQAVVADSIYARFFPIVRRTIRQQYHLPSVPWAWLTWWSLAVALRHRLSRLDPITIAPLLRLPLLAIHGGQDRVVSPVWSEAFYQRWAGPKERWVDPDAGHVGAFARDPLGYRNRVADFFDRTLSRRG